MHMNIPKQKQEWMIQVEIDPYLNNSKGIVETELVKFIEKNDLYIEGDLRTYHNLIVTEIPTVSFKKIVAVRFNASVKTEDQKYNEALNYFINNLILIK